MATKIPLVLTNGQIEQLQSGDSIAGGSGTLVTKGTIILDFGAFPGKSDASVVVTGQAGIVSGSCVKAWLIPVATSDHTADEHLAETINIFAGNIVAATGFTIYGLNSSERNEPVEPPRNANTSAAGLTSAGIQQGGGKGTRIYGQWTVQWMWF